LFEPVIFGQYTISLWCEQALVSDAMFVPKSPTKTRVCYQSYLHQCSNGIKVPRVPKFTSVLYGERGGDSNSKSASPSANQASPTSTPSPFRRNSTTPTLPRSSSFDPSLYVSPFSQSAQSILVSSTIPAPKPPVPSFVADAPQSYLWHVTIYKDGVVVHPRYDVELQKFTWAQPSWAEAKFTKSQLFAIFEDLSTFNKEHDQGEDTQMALEPTVPHTEGVISCQSKHILSERADYLDLSSSHVMYHFHTNRNSMMIQNPSQPICIEDIDTSSSSLLCEENKVQDSAADEMVDSYQSYIPTFLEGL